MLTFVKTTKEIVAHHRKDSIPKDAICKVYFLLPRLREKKGGNINEGRNKSGEGTGKRGVCRYR